MRHFLRNAFLSQTPSITSRFSHIAARSSRRTVTPYAINENSALRCLDGIERIVIRQENGVLTSIWGPSSFAEATRLCYIISDKSTGKRLFTAKEIPSPDMNDYAMNRRQISIEVLDASQFYSGSSSTPQPLLRFSKPLQLSLLNIHRPCLNIEYVEDQWNHFKLGEVRAPLSFSGAQYSVLDTHYEEEFAANMTYYQSGITLSRLKLHSCMKVKMDIQAKDTGKSVGEINSQFYYHTRKHLLAADLFEVNFPKHAAVEQKCRIIGLAILNDFWVYNGLPRVQQQLTFA